jgi:hypothetical protein
VAVEDAVLCCLHNLHLRVSDADAAVQILSVGESPKRLGQCLQVQFSVVFRPGPANKSLACSASTHGKCVLSVHLGGPCLLLEMQKHVFNFLIFKTY